MSNAEVLLSVLKQLKKQGYINSDDENTLTEMLSSGLEQYVHAAERIIGERIDDAMNASAPPPAPESTAVEKASAENIETAERVIENTESPADFGMSENAMSETNLDSSDTTGDAVWLHDGSLPRADEVDPRIKQLAETGNWHAWWKLYKQVYYDDARSDAVNRDMAKHLLAVLSCGRFESQVQKKPLNSSRRRRNKRGDCSGSSGSSHAATARVSSESRGINLPLHPRALHRQQLEQQMEYYQCFQQLLELDPVASYHGAVGKSTKQSSAAETKEGGVDAAKKQEQELKQAVAKAAAPAQSLQARVDAFKTLHSEHTALMKAGAWLGLVVSGLQLGEADDANLQLERVWMHLSAEGGFLQWGCQKPSTAAGSGTEKGNDEVESPFGDPEIEAEGKAEGRVIAPHIVRVEIHQTDEQEQEQEQEQGQVVEGESLRFFTVVVMTEGAEALADQSAAQDFERRITFAATTEEQFVGWVMGLASLVSAFQAARDRAAKKASADKFVGGLDALIWQAARLQICEAAPTLGLLRATVSVEAQLYVLQRTHFPNVRYIFPLVVSDM